MHTRKQVTVFLESKPGRLSQILSDLARHKINIVALSVMDSHEHGVLRLVTEDEAATAHALQGLNVPFTEADVLAVELKNQVGALAHVCEILAAEHVSIDYAYCSSGGRNGRVFGIFKVSNLDRANKVLNGNTGPARKERRPARDQRTYRR